MQISSAHKDRFSSRLGPFPAGRHQASVGTTWAGRTDVLLPLMLQIGARDSWHWGPREQLLLPQP